MPLQFNPVKLFAGSGSKELAQKIADAYGRELGDVVLSRFSDGEFQPHFNESVRGCDVFLIQSTNQPTDNLMELLMMIDAARRASSHYVSAVIPYFGLARQDSNLDKRYQKPSYYHYTIRQSPLVCFYSPKRNANIRRFFNSQKEF